MICLCQFWLKSDLRRTGNPSNQLAVLATYSADLLSSIYHYYRALCVKQEFPTARPNLAVTFNRVLEKHEKTTNDPSRTRTRSNETGNLDPAALATSSSVGQVFETEFVLLHAMLFLHSKWVWRRAFVIFWLCSLSSRSQACKDRSSTREDSHALLFCPLKEIDHNWANS